MRKPMDIFYVAVGLLVVFLYAFEVVNFEWTIINLVFICLLALMKIAYGSKG